MAATTLSTSEIDLGWMDNSSDESGFGIERSTDQMSWTPVTTTAANTITYPDTGLLAGKQYYYRMYATNLTGNSAYTATASAWTIPAAPTSLGVTSATSSAVNLSWTASTGAASYTLLRKTTGSYSTVASGITDAYYPDMTVSPSTTYTYEVEAVDLPGGASAASSPVSVTTPSGLPAAPSALTATAVSASEIDLGWVDNSSNETGFKIDESTNAGSTWTTLPATAGVNATMYPVTGLADGQTYFFRVRATSAAGDSANTVPASATTPLNAPTGLSATADSATHVTLHWTDTTTNAGAYVVEGSSDGAIWTTLDKSLASTATTDEDERINRDRANKPGQVQ